MWVNKIRKLMLNQKLKSTNSRNVNVNFDKEVLPKLNSNYKLNLDLYKIDKLITEIFTDLINEGFIVDYHM